IIQSDFDLLNPIIQFNWYRMGARKVILKRLEELAKPYGFSYNKVYIRNQKTKWGNCSGKKNLSFNWRLIKSPQFVMDYVIMHELVHTEIFKHTRQFWVKLKSVYPKYNESIQWLDRYGNGL
ncbi:MAG: M48 family metallopeptidase, partial [Candidatus Marinimicrobia bacterium]|nr:M48 family metallopeptidase [Candidatus Neomarinimicrobiota bacterium]